MLTRWSYSVDGHVFNIYYAQCPIGGTWSAPQNLSQTQEEATMPQLAIDRDGGAHVVLLMNGYPAVTIDYSGPALAPQGGDSTLAQAVTVPATQATQTLSFWYQLHGAAAAGQGLQVKLNDGLTDTALFSSAGGSHDWTHAWADLSPWAGQSVTLTFSVQQAAGRPYAWAHLDEVSVGSTYPDVWVALQDAFGEPGSQVALEMRYGNRGAAPAEGVHLSASCRPN
jgi:hypothetical protein